MSRFTPGPWRRAKGVFSERMGIIAANRVVAMFDMVSETDFQLMLAAPDLRAALTAILNGWSGNLPSHLVERAQRALNKAEGIEE